jgi:hypothetical protein
MADDMFDRVSNDPGLRALLKTARAWGVSPRRFLGWEPARTFTHVYDNGVLIRTVETREEEWDEETRDLAIAFAMWESDLCPGCNSPMTETLASDNEGLYVADAPMRCHSCTAREQTADAYADTPQANALLIPVTLHKRMIPDASRGQD